MNWTEAQREAIETRGKRVLVSAGAGSGKTRVLVERFLKLLEENPDWQVSDIVAVTFTEKAAREMVSRIRREIRSRIEQSTDVIERQRLREHRNALDSSRIGTIHSLCASLLRAHPAEAGLDPEFEVLEEIETAVLLDQAIEETLVETARSQSQEIEIFSYLTLHQVRSSLRSLIAQGEGGRTALTKFIDEKAEETTTQTQQLPEKNTANILVFWQQTINRYRTEAANLLLERSIWKHNTEIIKTIAALKDDDKREQCRLQVLELLEVAEFSDEDERVKALLEIAARIDLRGGSKKNWASENDFNAVKVALGNLRDLIRSEKLLKLELNEADYQSAEVASYLAKLYKKAHARFEKFKTERAALDFNDLEEITGHMLTTHEDVRQLYTNGLRIRALMIDEFQDTSPLQKNILWMIAPANEELFIIGDAKQSIYRFRGADVTVFQKAREEVESLRGRIIGMDTCFRTHTRLIDFVNHIFPRVFTVESRYDTAYEKMTPDRLPSHERASVEIHAIAQNRNAKDESPEPKIRLSASQLREIEATLIAQRIEEIIQQGEILLFDEKESHIRSAEYGDFALLFQASTNFDIYEQALADARIPYVTVAGRGFYARQEITDINNLLSFLASPNDNLSLASALRSPMFALSDETLLRLRPAQIPSLWKALCDPSIEISNDQIEAVRFARETLKDLRALVGRTSAAQLIRAAVRATGYMATLMLLPNGERRLANIEKLIEQTHKLSTMTLAEVVERIGDMRFREIREGEATIEESGAVRLMTVHKSKGLEFPVVWIVDATYGGNSSKSIIATHADLGFAIDVRADEFDTRDERSRAASFDLLKIIEMQMDRAEKKRLLYVAATRARDHLIISGSLGRAKFSGEHWLGRIANALGIEEDLHLNNANYQSGSVDLYWHDAEAIDAAIEPAVGTGEVIDTVQTAESPQSTEMAKAFPLLRKLIV
jgi:ATP-dependent helicase/nuclease subunit A